MRLKLDNGKIYDVGAMFKPVKLSRAEAWGCFRGNLSAWPKGLLIPVESKTTLAGLLKWLVVFPLHTLSLLLLPLLCVFGYSMYAYAFFTKDDASKLKDYRYNLQKIYEALSDIEDQDEYKRRLKEEIAKIKPY
ncbi:hypothetical protein [Alkalimarinus coralli]|uniref:hypothetical protein n=1 Tax=Alkalimarinus coralli TaxID=2935863 RepID=UPI00202B8F9C|nr:hypothetical protein [Alkalimarinus coralli]